MNNRHHTKTTRRQFIATAVPLCALTCLGARCALGMIQSGAQEETGHKFDKDSGRKLTYRQIMVMKYGEVIQLARVFEKEIGKEKALECIKKATTDRMLEFGKRQAERMPSNSFDTYVDQFRSGYENALTMKIVEDTERAFELKVTECIWADTFLRAKAGDIGFAWICYGDYAWPRGFNPKIKMIRDKTLMEGDSYCNHRYVLEG